MTGAAADDRERSPPPDGPPNRAGFFGPSNAAGFGGWLGVSLPILAIGLWSYGMAAVAGGIDADVLLRATIGLAVTAAVAVIPGYFAGWVGGAVVRWVQRRRAVSWNPWRAEFAAGAAAGTLLVAGLAVLSVILIS